MTIGDVRPHDPSEAQDDSFSNQAIPPTQENNQNQEDEQDQDQNENQDQDEGNDQGGVEEDEDGDDQDELRTTPIHPRVRHTIQCDHPIDNILGDIKKGVNTSSRVAIFCEHYSFIFSLKSFKVEDALHDPDWVVVMQEELNNFKMNEV
jgi:hypothetical protein